MSLLPWIVMLVCPLVCSTGSFSGQPAVPQGSDLIRWHVRFDATHPQWVTVQGRIAAAAIAGRTSIELTFLDLGRSSRQLRGLALTSSGRDLVATRRGRDPLTLDIALPEDRSAVMVEYQIDPTFFPPGSDRRSPADARSRATRDVAVFRTTSLLPRLDLEVEGAYVTFALPARWVAITPWEPRGDGFWVPRERRPRVDYLGIGPFRWQTVLVGGSEVRMGVLPGGDHVTPAHISDLLTFEASLVGSNIGAPRHRSVVVVPGRFMQGGAAGVASAVLAPNPIVLAHELFHWWMRGDLVTADARWFTEGFAQYVGVVAARETGLITEALLQACFADLQAEMRHLEASGPVGLIQASRGYSSDPRMQRLVYSKAALLALRLDRSRRRRGDGLRPVFRVVFAEPRRGLSSRDLERFFAQAYGRSGTPDIRRFVFGTDTLPTIDFGEVTGRSGCARMLPR